MSLQRTRGSVVVEGTFRQPGKNLRERKSLKIATAKKENSCVYYQDYFFNS
jgi:hypothetical protein